MKIMNKKKITHFEADVNNYSKTYKDTKAIKTPKMEEFPLYTPSEDIYKQAEKEMDVNPEDISKNKASNEEEGTLNEKR